MNMDGMNQKTTRKHFLLLILWLIAGILVGCEDQPVIEATPTINLPVITTQPIIAPTTTPIFSEESDFITVATSPPLEPFIFIDDFGYIQGLDAEVMRQVAQQAGLEVEFVSTNFEGMLSSVASGEFSAGINRLTITQPPEGVIFTQPYLAIHQLLVVRANDTRFATFADMRPELRLGAPQNSLSAQAAREVLGFSEDALLLYESPAQALQALIDNNVDGVILDEKNATFFVEQYFQQLKIVGEGESAWLKTDEYGIAVSTENSALLERLNEAITALQTDGTLPAIADSYLITPATINAGDSLIGTATNEFVVGVVGNLSPDLSDLNAGNQPATFLSWEIAGNLAQGLYTLDQDNQLVTHLFTDAFISEDGLQYTFRLRDDLRFADGTPVTAEEVRWSVMRSAGLGNWLVNSFLKDVDENGFADGDAVQALDPLSVRFDLQAPTSYFPAILATPPYFVLNKTCFETATVAWRECGGLGAYTVADWVPNERLQLRANPNYPGDPVRFANIQLRFYGGSITMQEALERGAIDVAWTGLTNADILNVGEDSAYQLWQGMPAFSSSLVFVHDDALWQNKLLRQAVAWAVDRNALAEGAFAGIRQPLYHPIPAGTFGYQSDTPTRNLEQARSLLTQVGYSPTNPLNFTLWYVNDGRYSDVEEAYAEQIKAQLEETGMIQVTTQGETWDSFRNEKSTCNYGMFLQGWPTPGEPLPYPDGMGWLYFFIQRTSTVCSNYESATMATLLAELERFDPRDNAGRQALYEQIQTVWADELPSLPLTQLSRYAISMPNVTQFQTNSFGLLRYDLLDKNQGN